MPEENTQRETFGGATKSTWIDIVLEELNVVNRLIIQAGTSFKKENVFMLKEAIDSWEQSLKPFIVISYNQKAIDNINKELDDSYKKFLRNWGTDDYLDCVVLMIRKKGVLIQTLFPYLSQFNFHLGGT